MSRNVRSGYRPGTIGYQFDELEARVKQLPWPLRWFMRRRVRLAREHFERLRDESLRRWFREHWA